MKKYKIIVFISFVLVFVSIALILRHGNSNGPLTDSQVNRLSQSVEEFFQLKIEQQKKKQVSQQNSQALINTKPTNKTIMAVIYQKADATWFIKAQAATVLINQQAKIFSDLFLQQFKFDDNSQPDFSHIPQTYQVNSQKGLRFASFNLNGIDVSVTKLGPNQDIEANINRWKEQLGLSPEALGFVKYQDDNKTILVRLSSASEEKNSEGQLSSQSQAKPPEKEKLEDFIQLKLSENWRLLESSQGMASANLVFTHLNKEYDVAILRLPSHIPQTTVFSIWKKRMGLAENYPLEITDLMSHSQQAWSLTSLSNQNQSLLIAVHQGKTKLTFIRMSGNPRLTESIKEEFILLLKKSRVIKP